MLQKTLTLSLWYANEGVNLAKKNNYKIGEAAIVAQLGSLGSESGKG